jgi:cytoskeleton protein RodZ
LTIEATDQTWLKIAVDDDRPYEILLKPGEKIYREASEKFTIDIGNAGGVNILFQGKSLGVLGKRGDVIHLTLPEE